MLFLHFLKTTTIYMYINIIYNPCHQQWYVITLLSANLTCIKCYHITISACTCTQSNLVKPTEFNNGECCFRSIVEQGIRATFLIETIQNPGFKMGEDWKPKAVKWTVATDFCLELGYPQRVIISLLRYITNNSLLFTCLPALNGESTEPWHQVGRVWNITTENMNIHMLILPFEFIIPWWSKNLRLKFSYFSMH